MSKILNITMRENIVDFASDYLFDAKGRVACLSGGKRPFLFIKKNLALKKKKAFYPPDFFSTDDFIEKIIFENTKFVKLPDIEAAFVLFETIKDEAPKLLKGKTSFPEFLHWALEILRFIDQLDLEKVSQEKIQNIKANADIGYDVPENINDLLKNIFKIRSSFHDKLKKTNRATKGFAFLQASNMDSDILIGSYDEIVLLAPFYLHKTEIDIFKKIFDAGKLTTILHGNPNDYDVLKKIYASFNQPLPKTKEELKDIDFEVFSAFDDQSQALLLKNLINQIGEEDRNKTVVIVPDEALFQPVISEISTITDNFNVSTGYPISKTAVFTLLKAILQAQLSKKGKSYYSKDLVRVLTNPLVKNMRFIGMPAVSRAIVQAIEQALDPNSKHKLSGKLFIELEEIYTDKELLKSIDEIVVQVWQKVSAEKLGEIVKQVCEAFFSDWEQVDSLSGFSDILLSFVDKVLNLSIVASYQLNAQGTEILISLAEEFKFGEVSKLKFHQEDIINIFMDLINSKKIALLGSPLKGLQILGLLESRSLSFENVYIIGMTDSALPAVKKESPLIPKDIMFALGIEMAKKEFEIQSYHFNRIIFGAKKVNFIYPDNDKEERSRFIEKLIWQKQQKMASLDGVNVKSLVVSQGDLPNQEKRKYKKTDAIKEHLKSIKYSYSAIDTYLRCRLQFYFKYVLGLDETVDIGEELTGSDIGTCIHEFLKEVFHEGFEIKSIDKSTFVKESLLKLKEKFKNQLALRMREDAFIVERILMYRMEKFLEFESTRDYLSIFRCEKEYVSQITTEQGQYKLKSFIDRVDKNQNGYLIFDYKTGTVAEPLKPKNFTKLMEEESFKRVDIKKSVGSLQLPLYKYIFEKEEQLEVSDCAIYGIKESKIIDFFGKFEDRQKVYDTCMNIIKSLLDEIVSGDYFEFDKDDIDSCKECKFFYICR